MDSLAALINFLFAQSCREHPAPPLTEKLKRFLQQRKLVQAEYKKLPPALQEPADCAMINEERTEKERTKTHG